MLSTAENLAIHLAFVFALPSEKAATIAGANQLAVDAAVTRLTPSIRGRMIDYADYLAPTPDFQHDAFRLDKEIQLAQLQLQHDECLRAWAISVEHANHLAEWNSKQPISEAAPPKKPYVGDIRFLQLAKHLRREMEKIESQIAAHLKEIRDLNLESIPCGLEREPSPPCVSNSTALNSSASTTLAPAPNAVSTASEQGPASLPAVTAARVAGVKPLAADSPKERPDSTYKPREIPSIPNPPPRRSNKYAGVNR
jgi:hypothetical protein